MAGDISQVETAGINERQLSTGTFQKEQVLDKDPTISPESFPTYNGLDAERILVKNYLETPIEEETGFIRPFQNARENPVSILSRRFIQDKLDQFAPSNKFQQRILMTNFSLGELDKQFLDYKELPTIIEQSVLEDRILRRLDLASIDQKPKLVEDLNQVRIDLNSKMAALNNEIQPHLENVYEKIRPILDETERIADLLKKEFLPLLGDVEFEKRITELWNNTYVLPQKMYENACMDNGNDPKVVPGFVGSGFLEDKSKKAIFMVANPNSLEFIGEVFTHESIHYLGPPAETTKINPIEFDSIGAHTEISIEHNGPLYVKRRDVYLYAVSEDELIKSSRAWLEEENNYQTGELRTWEAITDWQATEIYSQIHPNHQFKTGYSERAIIARIVKLADQSGEDMRLAIKKGLLLGDKSNFVKVLGKIFGQGDHYGKLLTFMNSSENLEDEHLENNIYLQRRKQEILEPAFKYFDQSNQSNNIEPKNQVV